MAVVGHRTATFTLAGTVAGNRLDAAREASRTDYTVLWLGLLSVLYNGILAFINHNIVPLSMTHVAASEGLIMASAIIYILHKGIYETDLPAFLFLLFTLIVTIYVSVLNRMVFIDHFRNVLIIFCFTGLGSWSNEKTMKLAFRWASLAVMIFLIFEIVSVPFYVSIVHPSDYFANTRGLLPLSYNTTGLFQNALGFPERFSFGIIDHRSSSIFLEQVSLANFCGVIAVYLISMWEKLSRWDRLLMIGTAVLILVTNDTRTMLIFCFACIVGYFVFPKIPKNFNLALMPLIVAAGFLVYVLKPNATGDNFTGRINLTMKKIMELDPLAVLGLSVDRVAEFADSGYVYLIYAATIFGIMALWLFVCLFPAGRTAAQRRCAHSLSLFIFLNMMIGGTAVFSMKIAGLLWFVVGYMRFHDSPRIRQDRPADVLS
ncbi:membrane protein [Rhizobium leguminosarum bv. trifolii WSM1689]|uniref:hypothetical protein n=1 Tax=Rhizobium leguminosarum TaxID=384 RepID=UPI0003E09215|nr:hypothetical protein [Rhizobium leguminosarum]AHF86482.1 membrane protein [Rhizobium leguminosarum bv. trifolii WSM1689]MBY5739307.1 hypothetical protein [Rhizobium leguminosarum]